MRFCRHVCETLYHASIKFNSSTVVLFCHGMAREPRPLHHLHPRRRIRSHDNAAGTGKWPPRSTRSLPPSLRPHHLLVSPDDLHPRPPQGSSLANTRLRHSLLILHRSIQQHPSHPRHLRRPSPLTQPRTW